MIKWIIEDWAGNRCFNDRGFSSYESAEEFLQARIWQIYPDTIENDNRYDEERGEYWILAR